MALIQPYSGHASRQIPSEIYSRLALTDAQRATTMPSPASLSDRSLLCPWGHVREQPRRTAPSRTHWHRVPVPEMTENHGSATEVGVR